MRFILIAACLVLPAAAQAQGARSIDDCEKIAAPLAYNQCLASFGPKVGERAPRVAAEPSDDEPKTRPARRVKRGGVVRRGREGRRSASFGIVSGRGKAVESSPRRKRRR